LTGISKAGEAGAIGARGRLNEEAIESRGRLNEEAIEFPEMKGEATECRGILNEEGIVSRVIIHAVVLKAGQSLRAEEIRIVTGISGKEGKAGPTSDQAAGTEGVMAGETSGGAKQSDSGMCCGSWLFLHPLLP